MLSSNISAVLMLLRVPYAVSMVGLIPLPSTYSLDKTGGKVGGFLHQCSMICSLSSTLIAYDWRANRSMVFFPSLSHSYQCNKLCIHSFIRISSQNNLLYTTMYAAVCIHSHFIPKYQLYTTTYAALCTVLPMRLSYYNTLYNTNNNKKWPIIK